MSQSAQIFASLVNTPAQRTPVVLPRQDRPLTYHKPN